MKYHDYYAVLGVEKNAEPQRIKQAYRRLARKHHPDLNPADHDAAERFKEIGEAYAVLSDPDRRRRYDQLGPHWSQHERGFPGRPPRTRGGPAPEADPFGDFSSFFVHLFGPDSPFGPLERQQGHGSHGQTSYRYRPRTGKPQDRPATISTVEISLEEAGRGVLRQIRTSGDGSFRVRIPPGVRDGARLKARTPEGDAMLLVRITEHPHFRREGDDLLVDVPVSFADAALGGEIEAPTLEGSTRIRLAAGVSGGTTLRVKGRGMPRATGGRGDLFARLQVIVPKDLTPEQKDFVRRFTATETVRPK